MFKQDRSAPVPADDLAAALAPFGQSRMLPREAYVDPAVFDWEQRAHLLRLDLRRARGRPRRAGQPAGRVGSAPNGVLLVRGEDGDGARVRQHLPAPRPRTAGVRCDRQAPQHRLPVSLVVVQARRHAAQRAGLPRRRGLRARTSSACAELRLVELARLAVRRPERCRTPNSPSTSPAWTTSSAPYRPEDLTIVARHSYELATNWKVIAENYQECYHCSTIHPELSRISPPTSGENLDLPGRGWAAGCRSSTSAETMSLDRQERRRGDPGPVRARTAHRHVPRRLSQPARQPAPRLRHDPPDDAARGRPHPRRVRLGVPERRCRQARTSTRRTPSTSGI